MSGFHTEGGGPGIPPPPPPPPPTEILKLSMVIIVVPSILALHVTGYNYVSSKCLESLSQIASEAI